MAEPLAVLDEVARRLSQSGFSGRVGTGQFGAVVGRDIEAAIRQIVREEIADAVVGDDGQVVPGG